MNCFLFSSNTAKLLSHFPGKFKIKFLNVQLLIFEILIILIIFLIKVFLSKFLITIDI